MTFETIGNQSFTRQELLNRKLHMVHAKMKTAEELSDVLALFCILATVDFNVQEGEYSQGWLMSFVIVTALFIASIVYIKIAIMYVTPRLETALFMSRYDIKEFDLILHDDLIAYMEYVWIAASLVSSLLFGFCFISIAWVRYEMTSKTSATAVTIIMTPVVIVCMIFGAYAYLKMKRSHRKLLFNEEEIRSGSPKVCYSVQNLVTNNSSYFGSRSRWDLVRAHVYKDNRNKVHDV